MSAALANRLNFSPHPTLRVYHHVAHRRVHAILKKDISSFQSSDCCIIIFLIGFLPQPAKMTDILPQMKLAFTDGPIARKVSISTHSIQRISSIPENKQQRRKLTQNLTDHRRRQKTQPTLLLPALDEIPRNDRRLQTLAHPHPSDLPLSSPTRIPKPGRNPARRGPESLLRRVHHVAAGPDRAQAGLLVFVWDVTEFECGLFEAGEGGGCVDVGV